MDHASKTEALPLEATRRGEQYFAELHACAPAAFAAVMDTLGHGEDPMVQEAWKASIGLTGGTCMSIGTCGAVGGAVMAVSLSFGFTRKDLEMDPMKTLKVAAAVAELGKRVQETYGHIQCQEIQFSHWGKSFRFTNPNALAEFQSFSLDERSGFKCQKLTGAVSGWAVECILSHNPGFSRRA
jgi:C_GCAxxG_C_C family probable redox protein